jgi:hypothetical protein
MANSLLTPSIIAKEALLQLENNLVFGNLVSRTFKNEFVKIGDSVTVRKPVRFVAADGATISLQDVTEQSTTITVDTRKHVAWKFSSEELTLDVDQYSQRYIQPAIGALAQAVDAKIASLYKEIPNAVGTAGTTPSTYASLAAVGKLLDKYATPQQGRALVLDPEARWTLADGLKGVYQQQMVQGILRDAALGRIAGFDIYGDQNIVQHTKGVATGTPLANGTDQTGSSIVTDGWTASTTGILKEGDIITFAGVYGVNPLNKQSTGELKQFVVTADVNSDASGNATIPISPAIVASGNYQNVTAAVADNAAITVIGDHTANMAFHKSAIQLVTVPLELPAGAAFKAQETYNGLSVRVVRDYDVTNDQDIIRLDILFGAKVVYPEMTCRLLG